MVNKPVGDTMVGLRSMEPCSNSDDWFWFEFIKPYVEREGSNFTFITAESLLWLRHFSNNKNSSSYTRKGTTQLSVR